MTEGNEPPDDLRIVTLNIRHGGGTQTAALTSRLVGYDADVLIITEFQVGRGAALVGELEMAGYQTTHPNANPKRNTVLVATRHSLDRQGPFDTSLDPHHLWCVETGGIAICAAYLPVYTKLRVPYWESLIAHARDRDIDLIMGDFNTGNNDLDRSPTGAPFSLPEMLDRLIETGYTDLWREAHSGEREYSYYSSKNGRPYNGFRVDHAFATHELARRVTSSAFDHTPRTSGETDHSALALSITPESPG